MEKTISFVFPKIFNEPAGGAKVILEYSNRLAADGYVVYIVYPFFPLNFKRYGIFGKLKWILARILFPLFRRKFSARQWFKLDNRVHEVWPMNLYYKNLPKTDIYVATAVETSNYVNGYPVKEARKFYFIQGLESWNYTKEQVLSTYHLPLQKIVISKWLKELVNSEGCDCELLPNGFDFKFFTYDLPYEEKDKYSITFLYNTNPHKGCKDGLEALNIVKEKEPELKVLMFGAQKPNFALPEWIKFYFKPDRNTLNAIYNKSAIYTAASVYEGWGLTIGEAMITGAAIACTDTDGFKEMVTDNLTGLLSPINNPKALADNIIKLIHDDHLRISLAKEGRSSIQKFTWDYSYGRLKELIERS